MNPPTGQLRVLITAGPTHEPIDPVRYIGNRSSGQMGAALAQAALAAGCHTTIIAGPLSVPIPPNARRIDIETAAQLHAAVQQHFPEHDLLIMAAAVADFRPKSFSTEKLSRENSLTIECHPTPDIVAAASNQKRPDQRIIGFSLERQANLDRATEKLHRKRLDMVVFNPISTMNSPAIGAVLIYPDGKTEPLPAMPKQQFANLLISKAQSLFNRFPIHPAQDRDGKSPK
jgi:phosphopantothenoylcysteine decarboxylase / phosphopantothenate---cysteine ligase